MWKFFLISLFGTSAKTIVFDVKDIQCHVLEHPYNQYYGSPCDIWKRKLVHYRNHVSCSFAYDTSGELLSGCIPSFGEENDAIHANYTLVPKCDDVQSCDRFEARVDVRLHRAYHPIEILLLLVFGLWMWIRFSWVRLWLLPFGHHVQKKETIRWNRIR